MSGAALHLLHLSLSLEEGLHSVEGLHSNEFKRQPPIFFPIPLCWGMSNPFDFVRGLAVSLGSLKRMHRNRFIKDNKKLSLYKSISNIHASTSLGFLSPIRHAHPLWFPVWCVVLWHRWLVHGHHIITTGSTGQMPLYTIHGNSSFIWHPWIEDGSHLTRFFKSISFLTWELAKKVSA